MLSAELAEDAELRPLEPWHASEFAAHVVASREHLAPWLPWGSIIVDTETARLFLQSYADRQARDEGRIHGIWVDGVLSGGALFRVFNAAAGVCEIGVWLAPEAVGRGLITKASGVLLDWAFRARGMARVEWQVMTTNVRSVAVARRLGFTKEGVMRQAYPHNGTRHDIELWSLLVDEWKI
ncbi:MAG: GNAT family N-acetyltransferase [Actinomycetota bacterium]|nr:GNAT family N-acetyltransferase [Actinomycetota bacterium]